ncbi:hypothetical protein AVEN_88588-1 [Araneus ventricosus]|uniref:Uncharacterized protein n=1 Tax=Araneus ventricosus TaxID=182803 RepID=A0A4Y1ZUG2_ARAVE|nr:hypothetical protein AVEN_85061-1 [Araneus ventricosus]GBL67889.1 hypothetical protein AVEN_88588-1 [Araneus ventricosus]
MTPRMVIEQNITTKVVIFCAAFAAAQASLVGPLGLGAPVLAAGHLGYGNGLIAAPAVATLSSQRTAINHVAPAAPIAAAAPLRYAAAAPLALSNGVIAGNGILANGLVAGHGLAAPLAIGNGLLGAHYGLGVGRLGLGLGKAIL